LGEKAGGLGLTGSAGVGALGSGVDIERAPTRTAALEPARNALVMTSMLKESTRRVAKFMVASNVVNGQFAGSSRQLIVSPWRVNF
jgi:hypothetical protein